MSTYEDITLALGHREPPEPLRVYGDPLETRLLLLLSQLGEVDTAIHQAALDSMAVKVDTMTLDYAQQMSLLKQQGSNILQELSRLSGVDLVADRYLGVGVEDKPTGGGVALIAEDIH